MACCWISTTSICEFLSLLGGEGKVREVIFLQRDVREGYIYVCVFEGWELTFLLLQ